MTERRTLITELPEFWQEKLRQNRVENQRLRQQVKEAEGAELSPGWQKTLTKVRKENAKYRSERNAAVVELAAVRAELEALRRG